MDLEPMPTRIDVDPTVVARLVAVQFPRWAGLPVRPVATPGWDNRSFRLGADLLVRMPSAAEYARAVDKEHRWLPIFAPSLPLPIPRPLAKGAPGDGYPFPWSVYRWIDGSPAGPGTVDPCALADFLLALQRIDPSAGPGPGLHNWYRGGPLQRFGAVVPAEGVLAEIWRAALDAEWDGRAVWFHGDVAAGNLLVRDGALAAVIDFGGCGVGDPAGDLAVAWTLLTGPDRDVFRRRLGVDDGTWARGRGWALWKALADGTPRVVEEIVRAQP